MAEKTTLNLDNIDLGSFGVTDDQSQKATDDKVVSEINNARKTEVRSSLSQAVKQNPDQYAKDSKTAKKAGLPVDVVSADRDSIETDLKLDQINFDELTKRSPGTAKFLSDFNNASIAHDDIVSLEEIEGSLREVGSILEHGLHRVAEGFTGTFSGMLKSVGLAINAPDQELLDSYIAKYEGEALTAQTKSPLFEPIDSLRQLAFSLRPREEQARIIKEMQQQTAEATDSSFYRAGQAIDDWMRANTFRRADLEEGGFVRFIATDVPQAIGSMFSFIAASMVTRGATRRVAPGMTAAESQAVGAGIPGAMVNYSAEFDRAIEDGATIEEAFKVASRGKFVGATEGLPIIGFLDRLDKRVGGKISRSIRDIIKQGTEEAIQEGGVELANAINRELVYNPSRGVWAVTGDAAYDSSVGFTTGALLEGFMQLIIPGRQQIRSNGSESVERTAREQVDKGQNEQATIDRMDELFSQSKVRDRDPEAFRKFVEESDGDRNTTVFVDAEAVQRYLVDKDVESDPVLSYLDEQSRDAREQGVDIEVPIQDFASVIAGTKHFKELREHMTLSPDSVSTARKERVERETQEYVNELVTKAQENVSEYVEAQDVFDSVRDQLVDTGMVTPQNAKVMAQVVPAYLTVFARKNGITVREAYEKSGLRVEGPQTGVKDQLDEMSERLEQAPIPEGAEARFKQSVKDGTSGFEGALDDQGNVTLVHYSFKQFDKTDPAKWGQGMSRRTPSEKQRVGTGVPRTYFGVEAATENPYKRERGLGNNVYYAKVPGASVYPYNTDPENLKVQGDFDASEKNIREAGYSGYFVNHPQLGKVVALFESVEVEDNEAFRRAERDRATRNRLRNVAPLEGAPSVPGVHGPDENIVRLATQYAFDNGIPFKRQAKYAEVDPEFGARVAEAYDQMEHNPQDPLVQEAYEAMKAETRAQYDALVADGYEFYFFDETNDPYDGNPWNAIRDLRQNKRMGVFATEAGFGSSDLDVSDNPLLEDSGIEWGFGSVDGPKKRVLANDVFRAVHDAFGHGLEGAGFRARGEENAWQAHIRLYSHAAAGAVTSETRGQNSWLNFGPHGEQNQTASVEETVFADQKTGLMPEWTWTENRTPDQVDDFLLRQDSPVKNELGLYSAVEKAVLDMRLPQWKNDKSARGADIWAKIKSSAGVKKEELEWLGLEEFLTANEDATFVRHQVVQFVRENGVVIEEVTGDQSGSQDQEFEWKQTIEDDESNWEHITDGFMEDFERIVENDDNPITTLTEQNLGDVDFERLINEYMDRTPFDDLPGDVQELLYQREGVVTTSEQQLNLPGIPERDYQVELDDIDHQVYNLMLEDEEVHKAVREWLDETAQELYMQNPVVRHEDSETGITIIGNDDQGYDIRGPRGQFITDAGEVYSFSEAEIRASDWAREEGLWVDEDDVTAARWEEYVTPGNYENYRELKLTLPEIDGDFENDVHFPDRNLLAFLRVTDRSLVTTDRELTEEEKNPPIPEWIERTEERLRTEFSDERYQEVLEAEQKFIRDKLEELEIGILDEEAFRGKLNDYTSFETLYNVMNLNNRENPVREFERMKRNLLTEVQTAKRQLFDHRKIRADLFQKKAFFIDEFQSDWHQQGRQKGYTDRQLQFGEIQEMSNRRRMIEGEGIDSLNNYIDDYAVGRSEVTDDLETIETLTFGEIDRNRPHRVTGALIRVAQAEAAGDPEQAISYFQKVKDIVEKHDIIKDSYEKFLEAATIQKEVTRASQGVPDAPFKGDAWMNLGIKRSLIHAAENDYEAVAWADSNVLMDRWSENYQRLYETQYDTKMPSMVKKLTKQKPTHMNFDGEEHQHQELGYWIIELTPELRERILRDGYPLFQGRDDSPRGYYDPANSIIRLTEAADLSTFLHEFGHFMYEMEKRSGSDTIPAIHNWMKRNKEKVAKEANEYLSELEPDFTQPQVTPVSSDDVDTFLDENTTGDERKDNVLRRATHEQFARGFETYLMEGKAPSFELRTAFRTFARWLAELYRSVRGFLNVNLDDQIRNVFDRLLATEEQIQAAQARAHAAPLFTDATMAGMTEDEFERYKKQQEKAEGEASETLRDKLIKQLTRQTAQWWNDEKADIRVEEEEVLRNEPVYRAINVLKTTEFKLDLATVREMVGEEFTDKRGRTYRRLPPALRNMTAGGQKGMHPDEAAAMFGFNSGAELLGEIIKAPKLKDAADARAQARMLELHGDAMADGTIEQQADEALQNEERGRLLLDELRALSKATRTPNLDRMTIKSMAEEAIAKLPYRQIHPAKYRRAELKAAQEAATAMANGDRASARMAKSRQVLNYYLGMAANDARNETLRIVERMARYNKKNVREEIQKAENGYWEQIVKILQRFEFRKSASLRAVDQRNQDINTWMNERINEDGDALILSPAVLNEGYVTHWKNVPFGDLQGINDSVKNIEHVARYSNKMERMGEEIEFKQLVQRWTDHMNEVSKTRFTAQRTDVVRGKKYGRWAMAQMTKIPYLASWLDGNERVGLSHQILVQPFTDAQKAKFDLWKEAGDPVMEAIMNRSKEDIRRHNRKLFIPEIKDKNNDGNLMGHQVLAVALNTGNQSNLRKLLLGEGWATQEDEATISFDNPKLQAVLRHMTASDWQLVQTIWDQMDKLYPQLAEVHRRTTGLVPPKVEATPIDTPYGRFRGGYYPVKYDSTRDFRAEQNEEKLNAQVESLFATNGSIQSSVNASSTNERTGYFAPIRLSLDVVPSHFEEVIQYITHHDAVREVNKLIRNREVAQTIKAKLGPEEFAQLKPWLNDVAKDGREAPTKMYWDEVLQRLRFGTTLGIMGFKASTGIIQYSGLSNTMGEVGGKYVFKAMRNIVGNIDHMKEAWEFASNNSKVLKYRTQTMDREIKNAMKRLKGKRGILAAAQEASMKHIAIIQTYNVDLVSWYAAYIKSMELNGDEKKAYQYADWVVENVQGSGATKDLARIMRNQTESGRMFTMFMTFFSSLWNMQRDLVKGARSGAYSPSLVAAKAMYIITIPVIVEMLLRGELVWDDDDEEQSNVQKILTGVALYPVQSIPFIRDAVNASTGPYGYNMSPAAQLIEQGTRSIPELIKRPLTDQEITKGQVKGATKFAGAAAGVPGVNQAWATGEHLWEVMEEGEELTIRELLYGPDRE